MHFRHDLLLRRQNASVQHCHAEVELGVHCGDLPHAQDASTGRCFVSAGGNLLLVSMHACGQHRAAARRSVDSSRGRDLPAVCSMMAHVALWNDTCDSTP